MAAIPPRSIPYELRIGVTGHRNLSNPAEVARAVERLLDRLQRTFESAAEFPRGPAGSQQNLSQRVTTLLARCVKWAWPSLPMGVSHTPPERRTPLEWTVISALAKGADRIVARAVLSRAHGCLHAVSPFPVQDYRRDFQEPGDRDEFDELWRRDPNPVELPGEYSPAAESDTEEQRQAKQARRNEGYLQAGHWVVNHAEIVIAVWDGGPSKGRGGTADVVRYAVEQGRTVLWINSNHPENPPRLLVSSKPEPPESGEKVADGVWTRPLPTRAKEISTNYHQLAAYNRDAAFDPIEYENVWDRNSRRWRDIASKAHLRDAILTPVLERLLPHYARADQLAVRYQALYVFAARWLHRLAASAVTVAVAQVLFFPTATWLIIFEVLALLFILALLGISRNEAWHGKWLRDRLLAEQVRIAIFTALATCKSAGYTQMHDLLPFYHVPDSWVSDALQRIVRDMGCTSPLPGDFESLKRFVLDAWISAQATWHETNHSKKECAARTARTTGLFLFCITLVAAAWHFLAGGRHTAHEPAAIASPWHWLALVAMALAIVLPAWAQRYMQSARCWSASGSQNAHGKWPRFSRRSPTGPSVPRVLPSCAAKWSRRRKSWPWRTMNGGCC